MIGIDTNILVRYLTQDDELQSPIAAEIIERKLTTANPGFVSVVVMAETAWVLDRSYGLRHKDIAAAIEHMLQVEVLVVEYEQEIFAAAISLKQGRGPFADNLIARLGIRAGCIHTLTFDKEASRPPGFRFAGHERLV